MLESLKIWPLLNGYRGRPAADVDGLIGTLIRLSYLAADLPEVAELDINPLLVGPSGVLALDARIVLEAAPPDGAKPYAHLALRPYPEEFVRKIVFKDGAEVTLRPIRPEDEPLWMDLLASCSKETIYSRFRHFFFWKSHEVATRFCYIDYDREMAIVAETGNGADRKLLGVGRLIADPDRHTSEYAILVTDAWQDQGLGGILTDFCLEIARDWGVRNVAAVTTTDNPRMVAVFRKRGFEIRTDEAGVVEVSKEL
jgi:acetyltransferase